MKERFDQWTQVWQRFRETLDARFRPRWVAA